MPPDDVVFDTTCLLYMAAACHDDLLERRYRGRAYVPTEVVAELERGEAANGFNCGRFLDATWWTPVAIEDQADQADFFELLRVRSLPERNRGEAAVIVIARRRGCIAVLDDRQGRRAAERRGVRVISTVAILARMVLDGQIDAESGWSIHEQITARGFRFFIHRHVDFLRLLATIRAGSQ